MDMPKIQALGITQEWSGRSWKATGYVEGVGWLKAWGNTLIEAMEALQVLAARSVDGSQTSGEQEGGEPGVS